MLSSDNELLGLYVRAKDEAAFEQLIRRHSSMVMGVCGSLLWQTQDAEDAFQAVFLLLSIKAPSLLKHNSVGGWLHESCVRTCLRLRKKISRTREVKMEYDPVEIGREPWQVIAEAHNLELLHKEIMRLPKGYRDVVVLCHLEGKSQAQCASMLDCTTASVKAALARGRKLLRRRLIKHGIAGSAAISASSIASATMAASATLTSGLTTPVPESLIQLTIQGCIANSSGLGDGATSLIVQSLIQKEMLTMKYSFLQSGLGFATAIVVTTCVLVAGAMAANATMSHNCSTKLGKLKLDSSPGNLTPFSTPISFDGPNQEQEDSRRQQDSDGPNDTAKTSAESWQEYVDRLHQSNVISDAQKDEWESGNQITITKHKTTTSHNFEQMEFPADVNNPGKGWKTKTIEVPYVEALDTFLEIPRLGTQPDDAVNDGFQSKSKASGLRNLEDKTAINGMLVMLDNQLCLSEEQIDRLRPLFSKDWDSSLNTQALIRVLALFVKGERALIGIDELEEILSAKQFEFLDSFRRLVEIGSEDEYVSLCNVVMGLKLSEYKDLVGMSEQQEESLSVVRKGVVLKAKKRCTELYEALFDNPEDNEIKSSIYVPVISHCRRLEIWQSALGKIFDEMQLQKIEERESARNTFSADQKANNIVFGILQKGVNLGLTHDQHVKMVDVIKKGVGDRFISGWDIQMIFVSVPEEEFQEILTDEQWELLKPVIDKQRASLELPRK